MYRYLPHCIVKNRLLFSLILTIIVGASPLAHFITPFLGISSSTVHAQDNSAGSQVDSELSKSTLSDGTYPYKVYLPSTVRGMVDPEEVSHLLPGPNMEEELSQVANAAGWSTSAAQVRSYDILTLMLNKPRLKQVDTLNYSQAVGVDKKNQVYYKYSSQYWVQIPGHMKHVSIGRDGSIWAINAANEIYRRGSVHGYWDQIPGGLKQVDALDYNNAVGVNVHNHIYYYNGRGWTRIAGSLKQVSYGKDGSMWGVNSGNQIYRRASVHGGWQRISGSLTQVDALSYKSAVGVNTKDRIYSYNGNGWSRISGGLKHVSIGTDASMWGANTWAQVYRRALGHGHWQKMSD